MWWVVEVSGGGEEPYGVSKCVMARAEGEERGARSELLRVGGTLHCNTLGV